MTLLSHIQQRCGVVRFDRFERSFDFLRRTAAAAEVGEKHVADRAIHRLRHQARKQRAGRADDGTGDDQRDIALHVTFKTDGETGERVVQ